MTWVRIVFGASAVYDLVLGVAFLLAAGPLFERYGVTPPNHWGYVHFPALLLLVFAALFARIAADPMRCREQMWYGVGLKAAYAGTVFYYHIKGGVPDMWLPFAWIDLVFLVLFVMAWVVSKPKA